MHLWGFCDPTVLPGNLALTDVGLCVSFENYFRQNQNTETTSVSAASGRSAGLCNWWI